MQTKADDIYFILGISIALILMIYGLYVDLLAVLCFTLGVLTMYFSAIRWNNSWTR